MEFPSTFGVAAGWIKTPKQVRDLCRVPTITTITLGSYTLEPREGNTGGTPFAARTDGATLNAMGLPNAGLKTIVADGTLREMCTVVQAAGKQAVVSIAPFNNVELLQMLTLLEAYADVIDTIEINCGCPNVYEGRKRHPIVSLNLAALNSYASESAFLKIPRWFKLSPHVDVDFRRAAAAILVGFEAEGIVLCNTIPDGRWFNRNGRPVLDVAGGIGGLAGTALLELSLANVGSYDGILKELDIREKIKIIGVGGISHGDHVRRYQQAGADGVMIGSAFFAGEDPRIFEQVVATYMENK